MKTGLIRMIVAGMMISGACVAVAETATPAAKDATKAQRTEWTGTLSAPATNAAASMVAVLTVKQGDVSKKYNLTVADAKLVAEIKALVAKSATVVVHGALNKEETAIAVTKCEASPKAGDKSKAAK
jgi:hypothetical protein